MHAHKMTSFATTIILVAMLCLASVFCLMHDTSAAPSTSSSSSSSDTKALFYAVEHSLDEGKTWRPRGIIKVVSTKKKLLFYPITSSATFPELSSLPAEPQPADWQTQDVNAIKSSNRYQIKISSNPLRVEEDANGSTAINYVLASLPTTLLSAAQFKEKLTLHFDKRLCINAIEYTAPQQRQSQKGGNAYKQDISLSIGTAEQPAPLNLEAIIAENKEKEAKKDEPGFLRKYWMYIVPVVILMMLQGAFQAPEQSGGGGGEGGEAAQQGASQAAPAAAPRRTR
eukprot:GEZU01025291.1.p1 GENE.GEZU01025291.1~~GEZU01025291.1.p1  ORF type:complete len:284 (-),score=75.39 GEZU01025291.1:32-883(-)